MTKGEPGGFWEPDAFKADDQKFFRATAADEAGWVDPEPDPLPLFERTPIWRIWRYADCKWWCRLPLLCKLARHVREETTP